MIEMTLPSSRDPTLAPPGHHVALLFTQYTPYSPRSGPWDEGAKDSYANKIFDTIERYCPGFKVKQCLLRHINRYSMADVTYRTPSLARTS